MYIYIYINDVCMYSLEFRAYYLEDKPINTDVPIVYDSIIERDNICTTKTCIEISSNILINIDFKVPINYNFIESGI